MSKLLRILVLTMAALPTPSFACSMASDYLVTDEAFAAAKNIFVFRLVESQVVESLDADPDYPQVIGRIRPIEALRGSGEQYQRVRFSIEACGGTRLEV